METMGGRGEGTGRGERAPTLIQCLCLERAVGSRDALLLKQKEMEAQGL